MATAAITAFGTAQTGDHVDKITLRNDHLTVSVLTWGAVVQDVRLAGVDRPLTLGSDRLRDYETEMCYFGSIVGPIINRISTGRVTIGGLTYELERNQDGRIHLHSGAQATHRRNWQIKETSPSHVVLTLYLGDGECGLPGNRDITVRYALDGPTLDLEIEGTTDEPTLMNLANHSYWNFDGADTWAGHQIQIQATRYLTNDADDCPTGEIAQVAGTALDFTKATTIRPDHPPLNTNFCLSDAIAPVRDVVRLQGQSGVGMQLATNQPGVQVYDGRDTNRPGRRNFEGIAVEAQGWPDAPTHRDFPSIAVTPQAPYRHHTRFTFLKDATK